MKNKYVAVGLPVVAILGLLASHVKGKPLPEGKVTLAKLIGSWEMEVASGVKVGEGTKATLTLSKDGKVNATVSDNGASNTVEGTFSLEGDRLTLTLKGQKAETETITRLDDTKLITVDSKGKESVFRKKP